MHHEEQRVEPHRQRPRTVKNALINRALAMLANTVVATR
jgi:hypothetical protein